MSTAQSLLLRSLPRSERFNAALKFSVLPIVCFGAALIDPNDGVYPPCPFRALTGYLCPGCGSGRALRHVVTGDVAAAFKMNPLMMLLAPVIVYTATSNLRLAATGRKLPAPFIHARWIWILFGAVIAFWLLRNLPAFAFLAPR